MPAIRAGFEYCDHEACLHVEARHRTQLLAQRQEELRKQREAEAEILRDRALQEQKLREKADVGQNLPLVALVPYTPQAVVENPIERRQQLLEHIRNLIQRAVVCLPSAADYLRPESDYLPEATEVESQVFAVGCRLCRGHCCVAGNTHAFLTISTIRRVFQLYPTWSPQQVFDAYRTRIPEQSVQGSCVFHGQQGCTLPRQMRADLCNRYLCRDLQEIRKAIAENSPNQVFFLASHDEQGIADYDFATAAVGETSVSE
ncbi:MAG: hypothetical protein NXI32_20275 [bacterium]|nr:hypothetical protein [bacterium]